MNKLSNRLAEMEYSEAERTKIELEIIGENIAERKQLEKGHKEIQSKIRTEADFRNFIEREGSPLARAMLNGYDAVVGVQGSRFAKMAEDNSDVKDIVFRGGSKSAYRTCDSEEPIREMKYKGRAFGVEEVSLSFVMNTASNPCYYALDGKRKFLINSFYIDIVPNDTERPLTEYSMNDGGRIYKNPQHWQDWESRQPGPKKSDLTSLAKSSTPNLHPDLFIKREIRGLDYELSVMKFLKEIVISAEKYPVSKK